MERSDKPRGRNSFLKIALIGAYFMVATMFVGVCAMDQRSVNDHVMIYGEDSTLRGLTKDEMTASVVGSVLISSFLVSITGLLILPVVTNWLKRPARPRVLAASAVLGLLLGALLSPSAYAILDGYGFLLIW